MVRGRVWSTLALVCLTWEATQLPQAHGQELVPRTGVAEGQPPEFLRYVEKTGRPQALEVAVVHYETDQATGAEIDLVGAVHIGEQSYYDALNTLLDKYDVVLYELVAPEGTVIPKGGRSEGPQHPVAMLQESARSMLALQSQLAQVDYTKPHFVRADMTPEQMSQKMAERGDTALTVTLSSIADLIRQQNLAAQHSSTQQPGQARATSAQLDITEMLANPLRLKQVLASQLASTGSLDQALGPTLNQMLVKDRNAVAVKVLQRELAAGKKRIAIFYGSAHLPDFHRQLVSDFGMRPVSTRWLVAWDLTRGGPSPLAEPLQMLQQFLEDL